MSAVGRPRPGMSVVFRPEFNVDYEVSFKFPTGRPVEGNYGPQVLFTVIEGGEEKPLYLDPPVAAEIEALALGPGELITLRKQERREGRKRGLEWVIARVDPQRGPDCHPAPAQAVQPIRPNGVGNHVQNTSGAATSSAPTLAGQLADSLMLAALKRTIDICRLAQDYASQAGLPVQFTGEDVRAMAITAYIQQARGGVQ